MDNNNQSGYNSSSFSNEQEKLQRKEATEKVIDDLETIKSDEEHRNWGL